MDNPQFVLRPSAAGLWVACSGYAAMAAKHPEVEGENDVRDEGNAAHWLAYETGNNRPCATGSRAFNGVLIDEEMQDGVAVYLDVLRGWGVPVYLEHPLPITSIHPWCKGTIDAWGWDAGKRILYLGDLKYGYRRVDAFENWQLIAYARGVIEYLESIYGPFTEPFKVVMTIVQPRGYGDETVKQWRTTVDKLQPYFDRLRLAAHAAVNGGPCTAGPHCWSCSAAADCATLQAASLQLLDLSTDRGSLTLTTPEASAELRRIDRAVATLQARQSALEAQMQHAISCGHVDKNFDVNSGRGSLVWKDGMQGQVAALADLLNKNVRKPVALITPKQASAHLPKELLDRYTEHRPGKLKLRRLAENHADKMFNPE